MLLQITASCSLFFLLGEWFEDGKFLGWFEDGKFLGWFEDPTASTKNGTKYQTQVMKGNSPGEFVSSDPSEQMSTRSDLPLTGIHQLPQRKCSKGQLGEVSCTRIHRKNVD